MLLIVLDNYEHMHSFTSCFPLVVYFVSTSTSIFSRRSKEGDKIQNDECRFYFFKLGLIIVKYVFVSFLFRGHCTACYEENAEPLVTAVGFERNVYGVAHCGTKHWQTITERYW